MSADNLILSLAVASWYQPAWLDCVRSWQQPFLLVPQMDILPAYQLAFEKLQSADIIGYVHDDVIVHDPEWRARVLAEFADNEVGIVGFGGAPGIGHPLMYQVPYNPLSMGRVGFRSNMRNAEQHGARFTGSCEVAVLDGFTLFIRWQVLRALGGWPLGTPLGYFLYDNAICLLARRIGYKVRLVGVDCEHLGGKSTGLNPNLVANWEEAHQYFYDQFKDQMPVMVEE